MFDFDVFVSYKVEDVLLVRQITEQLIASGIKPWFDEYQILLHNYQEWENLIKEGIKRSNYGLIFISKLYLQSEITLYEYDALFLHCGFDKVIQIFLEEEVMSDPIIKKSKWTFCFTGSKTINDLLFYIEKILEKPIQKINIENNVKKYYIAKCMGLPYRLNITSWVKEPFSLFSFILHIYCIIRVCILFIFKIFKIVVSRRSICISTIFKMIVLGINASHQGPVLYRPIENRILKMNIYFGYEIHPLQIYSRIKRAVHDRKLQNMLRDYARGYFNRYGIKECVGVHLLPHREFIQFAFTYQLRENLWCRKYSITLPQPNSNQVVEFVFTFGFCGSFQEFCRVAWLCDRLVTSLEWPIRGSDNACDLVNRAFYLVNQKQYDMAIILLEKAIKINPKLGDAYNELGFIYGRIKGDFERAEKYIQQALECDPYNPKFLNSVISIQLNKVKQLKSRREIRELIKKSLQNIDEKIAEYPNYPGFYLSKATALALNGECEKVWKKQLELAKKIYQNRRKNCAGVYLEWNEIDYIIERVEKQCIEMNAYWNNLPKE